MNAIQMSSMLTSLKATPASITGLIQDYKKLDIGSPEDRGAFILKIYKLVEPVIEALKEIPGGAKLAASVLLAYNDFRNIQQKWEEGNVPAADYFSLTSSSADAISSILYMVPAPQAKAAGLAFQMISGVASYGAVMALRQGDGAIDPELSNEREQIIRNHIPVKTDKRDGMEEYYKQAKNLLANESGWSLSMDVEIARAMLKQGYDQKVIMDAIQSISPCAAGTSVEEVKFYANYIIDREYKRVNGSLNEDLTTEKNNSVKAENPNKNIIPKNEQSHPIKINEIRSTLNGRMDELITQEKNLNQERDRVKGDPVTKLQAEKIAASDYLNGADRELAQQRKELQEKQDKLILDEKDIKKYGIENNFDKTLWRHAPNIFKGEGLSYYESSLATLANNSKVFTRQETEIQGKIVQLEKQLQTPEARLYIEKNSQQLVEKDAVRFMKFTTVDSQLSELQQEQNNIIRLRNILPSGRLEKEINLQGDGKDVQNVLRQANHIKQEVVDLKQSMALSSGRSRAM